METNDIKVRVWDTYVQKRDGNVLHFDIVVPENLSYEMFVFDCGKEYLKSLGELDSKLDADECQFCHIEAPSKEVTDSIQLKGYSIIELEDIPKKLPIEPSRRDMILYLKGYYKQYRFKDFKGISKEEVESIIQKIHT